MPLNPDDFTNLTKRTSTPTDSGNVIQGVWYSLAGHASYLVLTLPVLGFLFICWGQWIYLGPLFLWLRSNGRVESANGLFIGAAIGCGLSLIFFLTVPTTSFH